MNFLPSSSSSFSIDFFSITRTRRIATAIAAGMILFFSFAMEAQTTSNSVEAVIQGRQLAQQILEQQPAESFTNTGILNISNGKGAHTNFSVFFKTLVFSNSWEMVCSAEGWTAEISIIHKDGRPNTYCNYAESDIVLKPLSDSEKDRPFAGSDFSLADLGLEFFHWPQQKILKPYEMRRGRACHVLESKDPHPSPNGYSRVVSWIDNETLGIVQAEAYDAKGKLLKEFCPKDFKKVNGQWELGEMEMINDQTGSRTWIKFDLKRHN